jgi:glucokinase
MTLHQDEILEVNEFLVLDLIRQRGPITRPEICKAMKLAPSTVGRLVSHLEAEGAVTCSHEVRAGLGRPAKAISFNYQAGSILAFDLGGRQCRGVLADLAGDIHDRAESSADTDGRPFQSLVPLVARLRRAAQRRKMPVKALAIGVPAALDPESLLAYSGPETEWEGFELVSRIVKESAVPSAIENDVNLATLAQAWRGDAQQVSDYAVLSIGAGVGGGVVAGGRLVKGRHNAGGEFGSIVTDPAQLHRSPDSGGSLEALVNSRALVRRASQLTPQRAAASPANSDSVRKYSIESILNDAEAGGPVGSQVVTELLGNVAVALIGIVAVADPELIILDGSTGRLLGPYVTRLEELIRDRVPVATRLTISRLGPDSTIIGAIAAALQLARVDAAPSALVGTLSIGR